MQKKTKGELLPFQITFLLSSLTLLYLIFSSIWTYSNRPSPPKVLSKLPRPANMADKLYISSTPKEVSEAKGLHLITQNTPNGQAVQIMLEELAESYGTEFTYSVINIMTNIQKEEWFLRLDPNGRIPIIVDNHQSPPFPAHETSAEILYLLKFADKEDKFGFKDELERNQCLQWMFFWHGSGAPYQGQVNHFSRAAPEKIPCTTSIFVCRPCH